MLNKEIWGNGFVRFCAAQDIGGVQRLYVIARDNLLLATLSPSEIQGLALGMADLIASLDMELACARGE